MPNAIETSVTISFFIAGVVATGYGMNERNPRTIRYSDFLSRKGCPRRHLVRNASRSLARFLLWLTRDRGKPRDRAVSPVLPRSLSRRSRLLDGLQSHAPSGRYSHSAHK